MASISHCLLTHSIFLSIACQGLFSFACYTEWKAKAKAEVISLIEKHTPTTSGDPLYKRLGSIPILAWENDLPVLELMLKETLRHITLGVSLRRNVVEDVTLSGGLVKPGDFVGYPLADIHMNPEIYSRPDEFDPGRFAPGREEGSKEFNFVGWGGGAFPPLLLLPLSLMYLHVGIPRTSPMSWEKICQTGNLHGLGLHAYCFRFRHYRQIW